MSKQKISVVVACYNEEETVNDFYQAVTPVMQATKYDYEILFVNDGSKDKTGQIMADLASKDAKVKVINFSRNFSQQNGFYCAMHYVTGDAVITIDVDLQDPVEVIPQMIAKWEEGYEIVHGKRTKRRGESVFKRLTAWIYARAINKLTGLNTPTEVGEFKLMDRKVINALLECKEHNRFLRTLTTWVGFKSTCVMFDRPKRAKGTTKYTFGKLLKLSQNGIFPYSRQPLYIALKFGLVLGILSDIAFLTFIVLACVGISLPLVAWLFPTVSLLAAIIMFEKGISNIYLALMYDESLNRPQYIIDSMINIEE